MAHVANRGYPQHVVGESHYTRALKKCYRDPAAERLDAHNVVVPVLLKPDDNNKHDENAVMVISLHGQIGHLPSEDAEYYREIYGSVEHTTMCKIYTRSGDIFGAYLSLTLTENTANKLLTKNLPNHEAFTPKPKSEKKGFFARLFGL